MPLTTVQAGMLDTTAQYYSFKNRIINPGMVIDQRNAGAALTMGTTAAGTYGVDRWAGYAGAGSLWQMQRVSTGNLDFPFAMRMQRIAGQTSTAPIYYSQVIETNNTYGLAGSPVTLSFYVTAGANYSGGSGFGFQVITGTAADQGMSSMNSGTWTGAAYPGTTLTPTTTRTLVTFTTTLGVSVQEIGIRFYWAGSGTAGAADFVDITGVQLEKGSTATSFDYRPYTTELQLCQRYYEKSYNIDVAPASVSDLGAILHRPPSTSINITTPFKVAKRASPSVTVYSPVTGTSSRFRNYTSGADLTVGGVAFIGMWGASPYSDASTANNQYAFQFVAESEL